MKTKLPFKNEKRIRRFFAWFPFQLNGWEYWMEYVTIEEQWIQGSSYGVWVATKVIE